MAPTVSTPTLSPSLSPTTDPCLTLRCSYDCFNVTVGDSFFSCGWNVEVHECKSGYITSEAEKAALHEMTKGDCSHRTDPPTTSPTIHPTTPSPTVSPSLFLIVDPGGSVVGASGATDNTTSDLRIFGIVFGVLIASCLLFGVLYWFYRRRKNEQRRFSVLELIHLEPVNPNAEQQPRNDPVLAETSFNSIVTNPTTILHDDYPDAPPSYEADMRAHKSQSKLETTKVMRFDMVDEDDYVGFDRPDRNTSATAVMLNTRARPNTRASIDSWTPRLSSNSFGAFNTITNTNNNTNNNVSAVSSLPGAVSETDDDADRDYDARRASLGRSSNGRSWISTTTTMLSDDDDTEFQNNNSSARKLTQASPQTTPVLLKRMSKRRIHPDPVDLPPSYFPDDDIGDDMQGDGKGKGRARFTPSRSSADFTPSRSSADSDSRASTPPTPIAKAKSKKGDDSAPKAKSKKGLFNSPRTQQRGSRVGIVPLPSSLSSPQQPSSLSSPQQPQPPPTPSSIVRSLPSLALEDVNLTTTPSDVVNDTVSDVLEDVDLTTTPSDVVNDTVSDVPLYSLPVLRTPERRISPLHQSHHSQETSPNHNAFRFPKDPNNAESSL